MDEKEFISSGDLAMNIAASQLYIAARKNEADELMAKMGKNMVKRHDALWAPLYQEWELCMLPGKLPFISPPGGSKKEPFQVANLECAVAVILAMFH